MIVCPTCGAETSVTETRDSPRYVRRRRRCKGVACGKRVTTIEFVLSTPDQTPGGDVVVVKRRDLERLRQLAGRLLPVQEVPPIDDTTERRATEDM